MTALNFPAVPGRMTPGSARPGTPVTGTAGLPVAVNSWAGTFAQPSAFGPVPPALQSTVIALDSGTSVGGGSGTPSAGNWLFCIAGWNQAGIAAATVADCDDIHSFWRPGNVTTSDWAVSTSAGNTRTSIWYTPNLARQPADVYAAPSGAMAGTACLVIEVAGLGPWDTVTGIATNYAAAAESLSLALSAPSAQAFVLAAACGDSDAASQALAPAGWTALPAVTATNGVDHTCDAVLTSACLTTSGSVSVTATAGSATDLSGVVIGVLTAAPSPIPPDSGTAPGWPGRMILEVAPGAGFQTPPDELTWVVVNDSAAERGTVKRWWGTSDNSGVPYSLGQLQAGDGAASLDNFDSALSPANLAGLGVDAGTPVRLRTALGTAGGVAVNRWYCLSRNALEWEEKRDAALRNYADASTTDIWTAATGTCPSPYRGEVAQDNPYAHWACDDPPGLGGVLPTSLLNSAAGNSNPLLIVPSPAGVTATSAYAVTGYAIPVSGEAPPSLALYQVQAYTGWMWGDPQSSPQSAATGGPVAASPGAAAWQQTGASGAGGSNGWFLACNDVNFPPLSGGIAIEGWFNAAFFGSAKTADITPDSTTTYAAVAAQPYGQISLWTLATATEPVAVLYLDVSGHLNLLTYNGSTGTSHEIWGGSDLRSASFFTVAANLTETTWSVSLNGGAVTASGTATGMTSAWTWFLANGDLGSHGGSDLSAIENSGNVAYSHLAIYPARLPAWRQLAHYAAAVTGFGCLPVPTSVAVSAVGDGTLTPDGSVGGGAASGGDPFEVAPFLGTYGAYYSGGEVLVEEYTFSAVAVAQAGGYTSGPSARVTQTGYGGGAAIWVGWTSLAPEVGVYTSESVVTETEAAVVAGSGDSFIGGYGSSADGVGVCQVSGGSGASPPAAPTALGDTPDMRINRILGYAGVTNPCRAIDPAPELMQAALDIGGTSAGQNVQNVVDSDDGFLFVDTNGTLCYRAKAHLAADTVIWYLSSAGPEYGIPFQADQSFQTDSQRVLNVIQTTPYTPDGSTLPIITPSDATAVNASQRQYSPRPKQTTSYLQSSAAMLSQANWLFSVYGATSRRVGKVTVDAAGNPAAWQYVLGAQNGDLVQITDLPMQGGPLTVGVYRISNTARKIAFGANGSKPEGSLSAVCDSEPSYWWS